MEKEMNNRIKKALVANNFTFDGDTWAIETGEVLVAQCEYDEDRIVFCDCDNYPVATVGVKDAVAMINRVCDEEELAWLARWAAAAGYDVNPC
jgi:hypothetical protein